ncbi:MAG: C40 family peptidase [Eggerthellaceae bacterium]|nr:C40 family peptidase [Eggerthellaceae bacterium]
MGEHNAALSRRAFVGCAAFTAAALAFTTEYAFATTSAEKKAEADAVRNQLVGLQADLEAASDKYHKAIEDQQAAHTAMEAEQAKIDAANERIAVIQSHLSTRACSMYRNGSTSFIDFLLGSSSFEEFTQNWDLLNAMNDNDAQMVEETKTLRAELEAAKAEYQRQEQIAAEKAAEAKAIQDEVQKKVDEASRLVAKLDEEARILLEQEQAAAAAAAAAAAEEERRRQEALAQQQQQNNGGGNKPSSNGGYTSGPDIPSHGSVVDYALSRIGCPYVWGGSGPNEFDCSGLVAWSYAQIGIYLPHYSGSLYAQAKQRVPVSEARPGDVLWRSGHVGIAVGYGGVPYVHAPTFGAYVRDTDPLSWSNFTHALRF